LALALAVPFIWRLDAEEFHGDEAHWITSGQQAVHLLAAGRFLDAQWREEFYLYSQPQIGKLAIGAALWVAGYRGPTPIYDYDWQRRPAENRALGRVPPDGAILAARVPGALAGWLACLLTWALAAELGGPAAGRLGAVLLASHPLWLANARRAGLDAIALCLGLLAAYAAVRAIGAGARGAAGRPPSPGLVARRTPVPLPRWVVAGVALGLGAGAKYVALAAALAAAPALLIHRRRGLLLLGVGTMLAVSGLTFWATNPTLYRRPALQLRASLDFLAWQAAAMRRQSPVFASRALVAVEVVDRAVWPLGYPRVVDLTLPEALVPGSYGTPVVGLGAAAALVLLVTRRASRRDLPVVAVAWTAAVFVLLVLTVPIWWERWHLPLIPPLCLLAGAGLAGLGRRRAALGWALGAAQFGAALAMGPSYLGRGFGALTTSPWGAAAHAAALAVTLAALVSQRGRGGAGGAPSWVARARSRLACRDSGLPNSNLVVPGPAPSGPPGAFPAWDGSHGRRAALEGQPRPRAEAGGGGSNR
jgi:4-amino-4-deoxy-L-arabinose transferase-like glycosyltransferase